MSRPQSPPPPRILLGITGGIAAYKTPELVRRLREAGFEVRCALTASARSFVAPLALEVVSGHAVYGEEYLAPNAPAGAGEELHISAAAWADLLLVAPATSHCLAGLALGTADNFLLTTALAFQGPVVVAPAMHSAMWQQPATRARIAELVAQGVELVGPTVGALASGEVGLGRMADVPVIVAAVRRRLEPGTLAGRKVVVTAGPTWEPIDPVRFLGNRSSGKMGFAIAAEAARRGAQVELVAGPVALATPARVVRHDVETALEMESAVRNLVADADIVVMAAAVADYRPRAAALQKLKKSEGAPALELVANPDILSQLPTWAPQALRVGFAAETAGLEAEARRKLEQKGAHLLVANDVGRADIGFASDENEVTLFASSGPPVTIGKRSKAAVAAAIVDRIELELATPRASR